MKTLIGIACTLTLIFASMGNLSKIVVQVRKAQVKLIQETKASKWPKAILLNK